MPTFAPKELNGFPVVLARPRTADMHYVLVHAEGTFHPWIVATWWPELKTTWSWGHYFEDERTARAYILEKTEVPW